MTPQESLTDAIFSLGASAAAVCDKWKKVMDGHPANYAEMRHLVILAQNALDDLVLALRRIEYDTTSR